MKAQLTLAGTILLLAACSPEAPERAGTAPADPQPPAPAAAPGLHESLLVLDSHLDTPYRFHTDDYSFGARGSWAQDATSVDLPRMREGGLDGGFWVIYTRQGELTEEAYVAARTTALLRQSAIRELAARYHGEVELAFAADDAARIHSEGRIVVFQSMENAFPLGEDVSLLETFYVGGLRMLGPVHFANNQFADSSTDETEPHGGLSPLGEDLVREANHLGIIVDASHASDEALRDMLAVSRTPVILSHSGPDGVYDHARNVPDDLLRAVAERGGVIHVNAFGAYLEELVPSPERQAALAGLAEEVGDVSALSTEQQLAYRAARAEINRQFPPPRSTFDKYLEHLFYTLDLVGPNHVGIGADWDGGGGVDGMEDVTALPKITQALREADYSEADIAAIWGGNLLRVMREVEAARTASLDSPGTVN